MRVFLIALASSLAALSAARADWSADPATICAAHQIKPCDLADIKEYARSNKVPLVVKAVPFGDDGQQPISSEGRTCKKVVTEGARQLWLCF